MRLPPVAPLATELANRLDLAREDRDGEAAHRARVTLRSLRAWARLTRQPGQERALRWLGHGLGPVRELDLLATTPLALDARLGPLLGERRRHALAALRTLLSSPRCAALRARLTQPGRSPPVAHRAELRELRARARRRARRWRRTAGEAPAAQLAALHGLRRALRHLRDARAWTRGRTRSLGRALRALGVVSDLMTVRRFLRQAAPAHPGAARAAAVVDAALQEALTLLRAHLPRRGW